MKLVRYQAQGQEGWGAVEGEQLRPVLGDVFAKIVLAEETVPLASVQLLAPCRPTKAVCVGLNYHDHAREMKMDLPTEPMLFLKPPSALLAPGGTIVYPAISKELHYEAELAVVIGKEARHVPEERAGEYILGYACANDVTARDLQRRDGQWTRGKSFDTFLPVGPWVETDCDPASLDIRLYVNGECKQSSNTRQLIFPVPRLVAEITKVMTLLPGDVILTGTPSGVGELVVGDEVVVEITGLGRLVNVVGEE